MKNILITITALLSVYASNSLAGMCQFEKKDRPFAPLNILSETGNVLASTPWDKSCNLFVSQLKAVDKHGLCLPNWGLALHTLNQTFATNSDFETCKEEVTRLKSESILDVKAPLCLWTKKSIRPVIHFDTASGQKLGIFGIGRGCLNFIGQVEAVNNENLCTADWSVAKETIEAYFSEDVNYNTCLTAAEEKIK